MPDVAEGTSTDVPKCSDQNAGVNHTTMLTFKGNKGLSWMEVPKKGEIYTPRFAHSAVELGGFVYVFGGDTGYFYTNIKLLNDLYIYNSATQKWRRLLPEGKIPPVRCGHSMIGVDDDNLLVFGGCTTRGQPLNDIWCYNIKSNTWEQIYVEGLQPPARLFHSAVKHDGYMLVFGGIDGDSDVWRINLEDMKKGQAQWHKLPLAESHGYLGQAPKPTGRWMHSAAIWNNCMYIFGGEMWGGVTTDELWKYDLNDLRWTLLDTPSLKGVPPTGRAFHASVVLGNRWLVHGGRNHELGKLGDAYEYSFETKEWRPVATALAPWCQAARWGHNIVLCKKAKALIVTGGVAIEVMVLL